MVYDPQGLRSKSFKYFTDSTPFSNVGIPFLHLLLKMYLLNSSMQVFIHSSSWPVNMLNTKYSGILLVISYWKVLIEVSSVNFAVLRLISFQISLLKSLWSFSSHLCWFFIELGSSFSTWIFVKYFVTFKCFFRYVIWDEDTSSNLLQSFSFISHSLGMALSSP